MAATLRTGMRFAVIGIKPAPEHIRCADGVSVEHTQLAIDLNTRVAQTLLNVSQGHLRLMDTAVRHQRDRSTHLRTQYWLAQQPEYTVDVLPALAQQLEVDLLAYGRIQHTCVSGTTTRILGDVGTQTLHVAVEICLYEAASGRLLCHAAQGQRSQSALIVGGEVRFPCQDLVDSSADSATQQAIERTIRELLAPLQFTS
jgi:hypothetical protein